MPGMSYQSITQTNGFRVYILEGDPSIKAGDRLLSPTNRRTFPPPYCPIKRKRPAEACGNGQSVETCGAKVREEDPVCSTGTIGADSIRGTGTSIKRDHSPGAPDPIPDQPLALVKKRPLSNRPTSDHSRRQPPARLQQMRPSVITCAPPSARTDGQDQPIALRTERGPRTVSCGPDTDAAAQALSCDSVVDEHFRRSLGWEYRFLPPPPSSVSVSGSVDEHFAKALGKAAGCG